jgi:glutathione S-transferase
LAVVEKQLTNNSYLAGTAFTVADAFLYYTINPLLVWRVNA